MPERSLNETPRESRKEGQRHTLSRLSSGHSGLDYVESVREVSFFQGKFLRLLFTGRLRTRNPFYLTFLFFGALLFPLGLLLAILTIQQPDASAFWTAPFWLTMIGACLPMMALGLACLVTFSNSIADSRRHRAHKRQGKH